MVTQTPFLVRGWGLGTRLALGLFKRLEVIVPGCCCIPLLYNHLIDSCSYVHKNTLLAAKGFAPPLPPLNPPLLSIK